MRRRATEERDAEAQRRTRGWEGNFNDGSGNDGLRRAAPASGRVLGARRASRRARAIESGGADRRRPTRAASRWRCALSARAGRPPARVGRDDRRWSTRPPRRRAGLRSAAIDLAQSAARVPGIDAARVRSSIARSGEAGLPGLEGARRRSARSTSTRELGVLDEKRRLPSRRRGQGLRRRSESSSPRTRPSAARWSSRPTRAARRSRSSSARSSRSSRTFATRAGRDRRRGGADVRGTGRRPRPPGRRHAALRRRRPDPELTVMVRPMSGDARARRGDAADAGGGRRRLGRPAAPGAHVLVTSPQVEQLLIGLLLLCHELVDLFGQLVVRLPKLGDLLLVRGSLLARRGAGLRRLDALLVRLLGGLRRPSSSAPCRRRAWSRAPWPCRSTGPRATAPPDPAPSARRWRRSWRRRDHELRRCRRSPDRAHHREQLFPCRRVPRSLRSQLAVGTLAAPSHVGSAAATQRLRRTRRRWRSRR